MNFIENVLQVNLETNMDILNYFATVELNSMSLVSLD